MLVPPNSGALYVGWLEALGKLQPIAESPVEADMRQPDQRQRHASSPPRGIATQSQQQRKRGGVQAVVNRRRESAGASRIAEQGQVRYQKEQCEQQPAMREEMLIGGATESQQNQSL